MLRVKGGKIVEGTNQGVCKRRHQTLRKRVAVDGYRGDLRGDLGSLGQGHGHGRWSKGRHHDGDSETARGLSTCQDCVFPALLNPVNVTFVPQYDLMRCNAGTEYSAGALNVSVLTGLVKKP